ncbi:hypothetical protein HY524_01425 [Candidatus Berkelbacteria bacterium]|nr:hypothetical protein [Candidatus Berkelbacteria bacterium]
MKLFLITVLVSLVAGFGGGWLYQLLNGSTPSAASGTSATTTTSPTQTLADCLTKVWGADKYAAITANASLATTEDNFQALACYQTK